MQALIIYYTGDEMKAKLVETDMPDSSAPHVFGLPENYEINVVVTGFKKTDDFAVYIDEYEQELE